MQRAESSSRPAPSYIVVEGPIGVGKTTLVEALAAKLNARTVLEIFEENPFLADFYTNRDRYAFQTEMFFLLSRYKQQEQLSQQDLFAQHAVSDYMLSKCRLFASLTLQDHEMDLFDTMYRILKERVVQPDLVVYLHAPVEVLSRRIEKRGRSYERNFDRDYLERVCQIYAAHYSRYKDSPLITIDTADIDFRVQEKVDALIQAMEAGKTGALDQESFRLRPLLQEATL